MRSAWIVLASLAVPALTGCGGDDTKTVTRTVTAPLPATTTEAPTSTDDATPPPTETTPTETGTDTEPLPPTTTEAPPSGGPSQADAEAAARTAANDFTRDEHGISGSPDDWSATCTGEGDTFSCAVTFDGGQCDGRLTLTGQELTPGNERIGCGE